MSEKRSSSDAESAKKDSDDSFFEAKAEPCVDDAKTQTTVEQAAEVAVAQDEQSKLKDSLLRAMAENENLQKRFQREKEDLIKHSLNQFAHDLLPVLDNFSRALAAAGDAGGKTLIEGIKMTEKELMAVLERHGVKPVKAAPGDAFDAAHHQAMVEVEHANIKPGQIAEVFQTGYIIHDRLLRPALVSVVKETAAEAK
ncbi:MAG: nucleotide exchange factor GrpE [Holosporales bacterium]|jgi:molecular chaperone GrpE|nr:nucleotide exchange factor GrpE [Holosporales bacterium]